MSDYSYSELMKMQNDAIRRVEEMQKRARQSAGLSQPDKASPVEIKKEEPRRVPMPDDYLDGLKAMAKGNPPERTENKRASSETDGFFKDFSFDSDTALILSLVLLLAQEKGDETLIMALLYMLT